VTLVLSREVRAGHEAAFEDVLRRLAGLPVWARPLVSVLIVIPLMQYAVMPLLTRAARPFLYPAGAGHPLEGGS
jgi:antibiotic biosynthesis monooxygenase (ABM) superfamily enzyme